MIKYIKGLGGRLTLTYTLVTVLALLALEVLAILSVALISSLMRMDARDYLGDIFHILYPQASEYLQPGSVDQPGLQVWLEEVYDSGYASLTPLNAFDSPAALLVKTDPIYALSLEGTVLAQAPLSPNNLVGRQFTPPDLQESQAVLQRAYDGNLNVMTMFTQTSGGNYWMAFPVLQNEVPSEVVGVIVLTVKPAPSVLVTIWPILLTWVFWTAVILLIGVAPFGAIFGFIASRGLIRRLRTLTTAAEAWSEGDFKPLPPDRSRDEIGILGMQLRNMAIRIQDLLNSQKALAMVEERNRLARELHDTVKQQSFATLMQVRAARNLLEKDPHKAAGHLEEAEKLIKLSQQELGLIIAELRPAVLDERGLAGALQAYLDAWTQQTHILSSFRVQNEQHLQIEIEQAVYRVAQEALANVARHSRASLVTVQLCYEEAQLRLLISDNGIGFDTQTAWSTGFGMQSMQERLAAVQGELIIESPNGEGVTLSAVIPYQSRKRDV